MTTMTLDCSACPSKLMTFTFLHIDYQKKISFDMIKSMEEVYGESFKKELQVLAQCSGCNSFNIVKILSNYRTDQWLGTNGSLQFTSNPEKWHICTKLDEEFELCLLQSHTLAFADETCPAHCPEKVKTAFIEAEKAFNTGLFTSFI